MLNNDLMLYFKNSPPPFSINDAGKPGFGVGIAPQAALASVGNLSPMLGYDDLSNDNYGNYQGSDGSIMCFIPAFCYRSGYDTAPTKERDGLNALEITYDTDLAGTDSWILHRAFVNGGQNISGFFIDKYLASKNTDSTGCVSVKNGDPLTLYDKSSYNGTIQLPDCIGNPSDAIILGRKRGTRYCCASIFAYSAIAMLSLAHSQACGDSNTEYCAWNDENPWCKGNNYSLKDYNDSSVTYTAATTSNTKKGLTGSGTPFAKTTHNGQNCGVADIVGNLYEVSLGVTQPASNSDSRFGKLLVFKVSSDICDIESHASIDDAKLYDEVEFTRNANFTSAGVWISSESQFSQDNSGADWALTGCYARRNGETTSSSIQFLMKGTYSHAGAAGESINYCPIIGGHYNFNRYTGLFYRGAIRWNSSNVNGNYAYGFRCMAMPQA